MAGSGPHFPSTIEVLPRPENGDSGPGTRDLDIPIGSDPPPPFKNRGQSTLKACTALWKGPRPLSRLLEQFISFFQEILIRSETVCKGHDSQACIVAFLQAVHQHGAIGFVEHIFPNLYYQVRPDTEDVLVKSSMMQFAERQSVRNPRLAFGMAVGQDVRCFEQFGVAESTDSTTLPIGFNDPIAKALLVQALLDCNRPIGAGKKGDSPKERDSPPFSVTEAMMLRLSPTWTVKGRERASSPTMYTGQTGMYRPGLIPKK